LSICDEFLPGPRFLAKRRPVAIEPYIDAHSHIWTSDVAHYPLAKGFTVADMRPKSFTAVELLAACRPSGVGRVNLIQMSFYEFDNPFQT
jgi:predicted TIM-barrel fold metal-dependent hydrolase